ncbi:hypothetical protein FQR65_LT17620 [Abscondita terminalis]|nr:hypothetical protein FQR65_LT17620 [Abscondita terminalis]
MTSKINWARQQVIKLLELVEENECLWNVESTDYHNQNKRRTAIAKIATIVEMPHEEVKKKLHTLRAQYSKERSKMKQNKSGAGANEIYKTKWEYFKTMKFMFRHTAKSQTTDSLGGEMSNKQTEEFADTDSETFIIDASTPDQQVNATSTPRPTSKHVTSSLGSSTSELRDVQQQCAPKRRKQNQTKLDLEEQALMNRCVSILSQTSVKDEYSIFGDYVANELRLLKNAPDLRLKMKNGIQKCILEVNCENEGRELATSVSLSTPSPTISHTSWYSDVQDVNKNLTFTDLVTFTSSITKYRFLGEALDAVESSTSTGVHDIVLLPPESDNLEIGNRKLARAKDISDVDSTNEFQKRQKRKPLCFLDSESDDSDSPPPPARFQRPSPIPDDNTLVSPSISPYTYYIGKT